MRRHSLTSKQTQPQNLRQRPPLTEFPQPTSKIQDFPLTNLVSDTTSLMSDDILFKILASVPRYQRNSNFLVSKRWLNLQGRLVRSIKILEWDFLVSGRLFSRFPSLIRVHLVDGCLISSRNFGGICTHKTASFHVGTHKYFWRVRSLSLEGCSLLTTDGLESVFVSWNEHHQSLKVKSCNNIKDCAPSSVFSSLKDLKSKPDTKSVLSANPAGTGLGKKGYRMFKRSCDWKSLPGA